MHSTLNDKDLQKLQERLKQDLFSFAKENRSLEFAFESAAKHIPVYLKIVKGHIEQLAKVLQLETHQHRNLENANLAEPVKQLIQLFQELKEEDLHLLGLLALEAHSWSLDRKAKSFLLEATSSIATEA